MAARVGNTGVALLASKAFASDAARLFTARLCVAWEFVRSDVVFVVARQQSSGDVCVYRADVRTLMLSLLWSTVPPIHGRGVTTRGGTTALTLPTRAAVSHAHTHARNAHARNACYLRGNEASDRVTDNTGEIVSVSHCYVYLFAARHPRRFRRSLDKQTAAAKNAGRQTWGAFRCCCQCRRLSCARALAFATNKNDFAPGAHMSKSVGSRKVSLPIIFVRQHPARINSDVTPHSQHHAERRMRIQYYCFVSF